jgi:branched-chain amino acid transport system substrate-binding protein
MYCITIVKRLGTLVLASLCFTAFTPVMSAFAKGDYNVNLGYAGPLTGLEAHFGQDMQNGLILAIQQANEAGIKLDGKLAHFVLISRDDEADPATAVRMAQQLIDESVVGVLGHFNSGTTIPASQLYHDAGVPQIAMSTAAAYTDQGYDNAFRMMTSDKQQGMALGKFIVQKLGAKKVALIDDRTAYGQGLTDEVGKSITAAGAKIVRREYTMAQNTDFTAILTNIKAEAPDAIFFGGVDAQSAPMKRQMVTLGMTMPFVSGDTTHSDTFLSLAGPAAEGTYTSLPGVPLTSLPAGVAFIDAYKARFKAMPGVYAPYAYDGAWNMISAMKMVGSSDPQKYLPALRQLQRQGVTSDHIAYDAQGNLKEAAVTLYQAHHKQWQVSQTMVNVAQ